MHTNLASLLKVKAYNRLKNVCNMPVLFYTFFQLIFSPNFSIGLGNKVDGDLWEHTEVGWTLRSKVKVKNSHWQQKFSGMTTNHRRPNIVILWYCSSLSDYHQCPIWSPNSSMCTPALHFAFAIRAANHISLPRLTRDLLALGDGRVELSSLPTFVIISRHFNMLIWVAFCHWSENCLGHAQEPWGLCCSCQAAVSTLAPVVYIDGAKTHDAHCGLLRCLAQVVLGKMLIYF